MTRQAEIPPDPARAHSVCCTLFKAPKRCINEPREEMQKKRKVGEAEEEKKDEQRFAFTPGFMVLTIIGHVEGKAPPCIKGNVACR